jgi:esterase/lipase
MKQLLLLHGALGAGQQLTTLAAELATAFEVAICEFEGHGATPSNNPFTIEQFTSNIQDKLLELGWIKPLVFGYSMGGYVALKLESEHPETFEQICTLGTKFSWNESSALHESKLLNPDIIQEKVPKYAFYLQQLHGENWKTVLTKTANMMLEMGKNPPLTTDILAQVAINVHFLRGQKDVMVQLEETNWAANAVMSGKVTEIAEWQHPIDRVPLDELVATIKQTYK